MLDIQLLRTDLERVAKRLAEKHIHRIFVSGKNGPVGVISTMDVLKSVAGVAKVGLHA